MFRRTTCVAATPGPFKAFLHENPEVRTLTQVPYPLEEFGVVFTETLGLRLGLEMGTQRVVVSFLEPRRHSQGRGNVFWNLRFCFGSPPKP